MQPSMEAGTLPLAQVEATLEADEVLVAYFTMGVLATTAGRSQPPGVNRNRFPPARTLIFAVTQRRCR